MAGNILSNGEVKNPSLQELRKRWPEINFDRPLEFYNPNSKPDPDNPGRTLNPIYRCGTQTTVVDESGRAVELRYFKTRIGNADPLKVKYSPSGINIGKRLAVDLRNPTNMDTAMALYLLSHSGLGTKFKLRDRVAEAKKFVEGDITQLQAMSMLRDPENVNYIPDESLANVLAGLGIEVPKDLEAMELRARLVNYAHHNAKEFIERTGGGVLKYSNLIKRALSAKALSYEPETGQYFVTRVVETDDGLSYNKDITPTYTVPASSIHEYVAAFASYMLKDPGLVRDITLALNDIVSRTEVALPKPSKAKATAK